MKKLITTLLLLLLLLFISIGVFAQEQLTLNKCYELVNINYPLAKQNEMLSQKNELEVAVIQKGQLPTVNLAAQASYQSEVTQVPIDNSLVNIDPPNNDQYKATLSVNQLIYGGGMISTSVDAKNNELKTQQKQLEVALYQLKKQVNQLYFSILLMQEKKLVLDAKKSTLEAKLAEVRAAIKYGAALQASDNVLEAELLRIDQLMIDVNQNKKSLIVTLSQLIGQEISLATTLNSPVVETNMTTDLSRPELELFELQKQQIMTSEQLLSKNKGPKLFGFADGGIGNPGLNFLDNTFQPFYMVGLRFNWNILDWNATKKQRMSLLINKDIIDNQQEVFKFNTTIELNQQQLEMEKIAAFIVSDRTIIELREKILKAADAQLKNGVITSSAYITELTNLFEAENNLKTHEIQLLLATANYNTTQGN